jgi:hypothetical protein
MADHCRGSLMNETGTGLKWSISLILMIMIIIKEAVGNKNYSNCV